MNIGAVSIHPSGQVNKRVGMNFNLECSVSISLPVGVPDPNLEWLFGPNNASLPIGVVVAEVGNNRNMYASTLQFIPLRESHQGIYICRVGTNTMLAASVKVSTCMSINDLYKSCIS